MRWLNYHHLLYFKVIAEEGGIARAAEKLRLGQPTLSTQLKQLEDVLGKPLFERRNRKMILTEAGASALNYANEIFRLGDEMQEVLQDRPVANQVHLQVGALDGVPKSVTLALVSAALKAAPCTVSILEGKGDELLRELSAHRLDLILSNYPPLSGGTTQIYARSVAKINVAVFGSSRFRGLKKDFPKSLSGQPFVLPTIHSKLRQDLNHYFKLKNLPIVVAAETQDTSLQRLMASDGIGMAPLSEVKAPENEILHKIGRLAGVFEEIWLVSAQRKIENPVAARLMASFHLNPNKSRS
ncbi:MAG: LysR family transcriptional regulator [Bdellovibrionales bacterium]